MGPANGEGTAGKAQAAQASGHHHRLPFNFFVIGCDGCYTMENAVSKTQQRAHGRENGPKKLCLKLVEHYLAHLVTINRASFRGKVSKDKLQLSLGGEGRFCTTTQPPLRLREREPHEIPGGEHRHHGIQSGESGVAEGAMMKLERAEWRKRTRISLFKVTCLYSEFAEASGQGSGWPTSTAD